MSKFVGTGPSSYEKRIYRAAVSQRLRITATGNWNTPMNFIMFSSLLVIYRHKSSVVGTGCTIFTI
jgi:hypothetical protein